MISHVELMNDMHWYLMTSAVIMLMIYLIFIWSVLPYKLSNFLFRWVKRYETNLEKIMLLLIGSTVPVMLIYILLENYVRF